MKSLLKIYGKYIGITWVIGLLLLIVNIGVFGWILIEQYQRNEPVFSMGIQAMENIAFEKNSEDELVLTQQGKDYLKERDFIFLMVLNDDGKLIYSWNLPEGFQSHYTAGEIASFTRWYLNDYPVKTWNTEKGLLVAGREKNSTWKHMIEFSEGFVRRIGTYFGMILEINFFIILGVIAFLGYRYYQSLLPLSEGIGALAANQKIHLPEKGVTSGLAAQINHTSDILEQQRNMLNKRDNARTEWIAGVSHDIRTPLSVIMGYADELEQQEHLREEERNKAAVIKSQSLKIRQLIEDLNLTSKLEYHMQPLRLSAFYPAALLRRLAAETLNEGLGWQYGLMLEISGELEGVVLWGDEELLARAVRNLLNNSIRHNPSGCKIWVAGSRKADKCILKVTDDGCGISKEIVEVLEREGEGIDGESTEQSTGKLQKEPHIMGLRIVKQITLAHKGSFEIKEEGHSVELALPITE